MIRQVSAPGQRQVFAVAIAGEPYLAPVLGRDLAIWADNLGAPVRLFTASGAALSLSGSAATLCGVPGDEEELLAFLRFAGVRSLLSARPLAMGEAGERYSRYTLAPGGRLAGAPSEAPAGLVLDQEPSMGQVAAFLFPGDAGRQDNLYTEGCAARARGMARVWALRRPGGEILSTVGAYAVLDGAAAMAMGCTHSSLRGRGIGGWLIARMAETLAREGLAVSLLCAPERCPFYQRLGFAPAGPLWQYKINNME